MKKLNLKFWFNINKFLKKYINDYFLALIISFYCCGTSRPIYPHHDEKIAIASLDSLDDNISRYNKNISGIGEQTDGSLKQILEV